MLFILGMINNYNKNVYLIFWYFHTYFTVCTNKSLILEEPGD